MEEDVTVYKEAGWKMCGTVHACMLRALFGIWADLGNSFQLGVSQI